MSDLTIREVGPADHDAVLALAPRLTEGVAAWRDAPAVLSAVVGWVEGSLTQAGDDPKACFVAETGGEIVGFVSVTEQEHWSGVVDGYVGELVVAAEHSGQGIGGRLMEYAETWSSERGLTHLTLATGAANQAARGFYGSRGYLEEDVRLTKRLSG